MCIVTYLLGNLQVRCSSQWRLEWVVPRICFHPLDAVAASNVFRKYIRLFSIRSRRSLYLLLHLFSAQTSLWTTTVRCCRILFFLFSNWNKLWFILSLSFASLFFCSCCSKNCYTVYWLLTFSWCSIIYFNTRFLAVSVFFAPIFVFFCPSWYSLFCCKKHLH